MKKHQPVTKCPNCHTLGCYALECRAEREWGPEEWAGALRMTEARLAAGYMIQTKPRVVARSSPEFPSEPDDVDQIEWDAVRVPLVLTAMDHRAIEKGIF
jgi:hypothetical protein